MVLLSQTKSTRKGVFCLVQLLEGLEPWEGFQRKADNPVNCLPLKSWADGYRTAMPLGRQAGKTPEAAVSLKVHQEKRHLRMSFFHRYKFLTEFAICTSYAIYCLTAMRTGIYIISQWNEMRLYRICKANISHERERVYRLNVRASLLFAFFNGLRAFWKNWFWNKRVDANWSWTRFELRRKE